MKKNILGNTAALGSKSGENWAVSACRQLWLLPFFGVFCTALIVVPSWTNGTVTGKYVWFYGSMLAVAVAATVFAMLERTAWRAGFADVLIAAYGVGVVCINLLCFRPVEATKLILMLLIVVLYFYFSIFLQASPRFRYGLWLFLLVVALVEAVWGVMQLHGILPHYHGYFRLTGSFYNPGPYACWLAVIVPCAFYYVLRDIICTKVHFKLGRWPVYLRWIVALMVCICTALVLPASMSRTAWLGALAGGITVMVMVKQRLITAIFRRYRTFVIIGGAVLLIAGGAGMYAVKKDSADGRMLIWKISAQAFAKAPLGVGTGHFPAAYGRAQAAYFRSGSGSEREEYIAGNPDAAFNEYLQIGIEQGAIFLALFLFITGYSLYIGIRRRRVAAVSGMVALLTVAFSSYPFSVLPFLILPVFFLADIHSPAVCLPAVWGRGAFVWQRLAAYAGLVIVLLCCINRYPVCRAYHECGGEWMHGNNIEEHERLETALGDNLLFLFHYGRMLSDAGRYADSNRILQRAATISCDPMLYCIMGRNCQSLKQYTDAEQCLRQAADMVPARLYPWYLLTKLYAETGDIEKMLSAAKTVLLKVPKIESTAIMEMRTEFEKILIKHK